MSYAFFMTPLERGRGRGRGTRREGKERREEGEVGGGEITNAPVTLEGKVGGGKGRGGVRRRGEGEGEGNGQV